MDKKVDSLGLVAKKSLVNFVGKMDERLSFLWKEELEKNFGFNETQRGMVEKMLKHASEHNLRAAKRIRAAFAWYGWNLISGMDSRLHKNSNRGGDIWKVCEGIELVHTALLMHDDFMDRDTVRRGGQTTQEFFADGDQHFGESMAVCLGDAVLCLGFERVQRSGFEAEKTLKVMNQLQRGIANTAFGQAYDAYLPKLEKLDEKNVLDLHRAKTAIYTYENPLIIGGLLAGLPNEALDILREYSVMGGIAFQLQDDILGIFGDEEKTGKSVNSDLLQGKVTLMVVKTMELGSETQKKDLLAVWGKQKANAEEIEKAKLAIQESGAYEYNKQIAVDYARKAVEVAKRLRKLNLNSESIDFIEGVAEYMVERDV